MKKLFSLFIIGLLGFCILSFVVLPLIISQSDVQKFLKEKIRAKAGDRFEVERIGVGFFPMAFVEVKGIKVYPPSSSDHKPLFTAQTVRLYLKIIPLLFKQFEAKRLTLERASFYLEVAKKFKEGIQPPPAVIELTDINGAIRNLRSNAPAKFKIKGFIYGKKGGTLQADGQVRMSLEKLKLRIMEFSSRFDIQNVAVNQLIEAGLIEKTSALSDAQIKIGGSLGMASDTRNIEGKINLMASKMELKGPQVSQKKVLIIHLPGAVNVSSQFLWNPQNRVLEIRKSDLSLPGIEGNAFGTVNFLAEPQLDLSVRFKEINFDDMEKIYAPLLKGAKVDLSGKGTGTLIFKGTSAKLLVSADADLSGTGIQIQSLVGKPVGRGFTFSAQTYLSGSQLSDGEFTARVGEMSVKGTTQKMDLSTKFGEINFITNKFPLAEWNGLVPSLNNFKISGSAKIVANIKGDFTDVKSLRYSAHVTLDQAVLHQDGSVLLQNLSGSFDVEPEKFGIQESRLLFGKSDLEVAMDLRDFDSPFFQARVGSSNLEVEDLNALVDRLKDFKLQPVSTQPAGSSPTAWISSFLEKEAFAAQASAPNSKGNAGELPPILYRAKGTADLNLANVSWSGRQLETVKGRLEWNRGVLLIQEIRGSKGSGVAVVSGSVTWQSNPGSYNFHAETEGIPVEGLLTKKFLKGALDSTSDYQGFFGNKELVQNSLRGQGVFKIRDGEIRGVSLLGALSALPSFVGLGKGAKIGGATQFSTLDGQFQIAEQKIQLNPLKLQSDAANAAAQGIIGFDKSLDFQGVVEVTGGLGGILGGASRETPLRFPLQVTGTTDHPHVNITQTAMGSTVVQDALGRFLGGKKKSAKTTSSSTSSGSTAAELLQSILGGGQ